ncbi:MAG TPA: hypothetical protein VFK45_01590, partial [Gammaproteobacteria bacterium]|nr:hypothetical protein [Gammaproteobacteria bacterium]
DDQYVFVLHFALPISDPAQVYRRVVKVLLRSAEFLSAFVGCSPAAISMSLRRPDLKRIGMAMPLVQATTQATVGCRLEFTL